jgi:tetratricopeptide (TPR) repeat protein
MSGYRSPLDAYRDDLSRAGGKKRLAAGDEFWIILATGLRRLSQAPPRKRGAAARRLAVAIDAVAAGLDASSAKRGVTPRAARASENGRPTSVAAALAHYPDPAHASDLVTQVRGAAADAEEAGAVVLAREMLTDLRALTPRAPALERGLVLLQLGRIERTLGSLETASDLLRAAGELGRSENVDELRTREALGLAVVARVRGNYPAARSLFETALKEASANGLADVTGMAHQGLMIVRAEAHEYDAALVHGWKALSAARTEGAREAEVLGNLAHLCAKAGYPAAAIGGFSAALARTSVPRLRLPILAGMILSAARVGNRSLVDSTEQRITEEASHAFPFETASAWLAASRARRALGDTLAGDAAAMKAAAIARSHGFHEIAHRLADEESSQPAPLAETVLGVVRSLESWSEDPEADLALSMPTG